MSESIVSPTLLRIRALEQNFERAKSRAEAEIGGGGGTSDGMNERLGKLEVRVDGVERRLESIDATLDRVESALRDLTVTVAKLPSRDFLLGAMALFFGSAIAIAALTFNIADYAAKVTQQSEQAKAAPHAPTSQPIIITLPSTSPVIAPSPALLPSRPAEQSVTPVDPKP